MRLIVRKERPHPVTQLRFTDLDGLRLTCFATNTKGGWLSDLGLRPHRRARCEDRIRARATGLRNLPLHDTAQNRIWLEIVSLALDLPGPTQARSLDVISSGALTTDLARLRQNASPML